MANSNQNNEEWFRLIQFKSDVCMSIHEEHAISSECMGILLVATRVSCIIHTEMNWIEFRADHNSI